MKNVYASLVFILTALFFVIILQSTVGAQAQGTVYIARPNNGTFPPGTCFTSIPAGFPDYLFIPITGSCTTGTPAPSPSPVPSGQSTPTPGPGPTSNPSGTLIVGGLTNYYNCGSPAIPLPTFAVVQNCVSGYGQLQNGVFSASYGYTTPPTVFVQKISDPNNLVTVAGQPSSTGFSVQSTSGGFIATSDNSIFQFLIVGIGSVALPIPTPSGVVTASPTPTPSPTPTMVGATPTPTPTPSPTPSPTALAPLVLSTPGQGTLIASEAGYLGLFNVLIADPTVASISPTVGNGTSQTFTITDLIAGRATLITISDQNGQSQSLTIITSTPTPTPSPTPLPTGTPTATPTPAGTPSPIATVHPAYGGTLTISSSDTMTTNFGYIGLSNPGVAGWDWTAWGDASNTPGQQQQTGATVFTPYTVIGTGTPAGGTQLTPKFSWNDGTPVAVRSFANEGVRIGGSVGSGFQIQVAADTTPRTLTIYAATSCATQYLLASMSDNSGTAVNEDAFSLATPAYRTYAVTFAATSLGQTLTVQIINGARYPGAGCTMDAAVNAYLQAATLAIVANPSPAPIGTPTPIPTPTPVPTASPIYAGTLSIAPPTATVAGPTILTGSGGSDWIDFGAASGLPGVDHAIGGGSRIPTYTIIGPASTAIALSGTPTFSWTDGTPRLTVNNTASSVAVNNALTSGIGFQFQLPADTTPRTVTVYASANCTNAQLTATINDGSPFPSITDASVTAGSVRLYNTYVISYASTTPARVLTLSYVTAPTPTVPGCAGTGTSASVGIAAIKLSP